MLRFSAASLVSFTSSGVALAMTASRNAALGRESVWRRR